MNSQKHNGYHGDSFFMWIKTLFVKLNSQKSILTRNGLKVLFLMGIKPLHSWNKPQVDAMSHLMALVIPIWCCLTLLACSTSALTINAAAMFRCCYSLYHFDYVGSAVTIAIDDFQKSGRLTNLTFRWVLFYTCMYMFALLYSTH